jgi:hypothetical protein
MTDKNSINEKIEGYAIFKQRNQTPRILEVHKKKGFKGNYVEVSKDEWVRLRDTVTVYDDMDSATGNLPSGLKKESIFWVLVQHEHDKTWHVKECFKKSKHGRLERTYADGTLIPSDFKCYEDKDTALRYASSRNKKLEKTKGKKSIGVREVKGVKHHKPEEIKRRLTAFGKKAKNLKMLKKMKFGKKAKNLKMLKKMKFGKKAKNLKMLKKMKFGKKVNNLKMLKKMKFGKKVNNLKMLKKMKFGKKPLKVENAKIIRAWVVIKKRGKYEIKKSLWKKGKLVFYNGKKVPSSAKYYKSKMVANAALKNLKNVSARRVKSGSVKSGSVKSGSVKSGSVKSGRVKSGRVKSGRVKSSSGRVKSGRVKSGSVKSSSGRVKSGRVSAMRHKVKLDFGKKSINYGFRRV